MRVKESHRLETIKSRADISDLFSCGRRLHTPYLTFIVLPAKQHGPCGRVAFIAGKKMGNAVWRNGAKRRMREVCRALGGPWAGYDVIFLAKSSLMRCSYSKVLAACSESLERAKIR
ncbi:ribonuclease P protein component [Gordonibacter sp. An230]|uniref:ribonuclease P protein component n=1 Tax=Gordonibacter sp. An230 TaxID=1965592 RepID=UPI0031454281